MNIERKESACVCVCVCGYVDGSGRRVTGVSGKVLERVGCERLEGGCWVIREGWRRKRDH